MYSEINIDLTIPIDTHCCDEWGAAYLWLNKEQTKGVEYNLCYDGGENQSAIYAMYTMYGDPAYPTGYLSTDNTTYMHYEIDFDDMDWKNKLISAMRNFAALLLDKGYWDKDGTTDLMHDGYGTVWYTKKNKPRWCYIGMAEESLLDKYDIIKADMDNPDEDWTQFEVSFSPKGKLKQFHYLVFNNGGDICDLIGKEIKHNNEIVGHSLLTHDEFKQIVAKAKAEYDKEYENINWNKEDM